MAHVKAIHKNAKISPMKVRPFADLIRGKSAAEAVVSLRFVHNRGAKMLAKVLASAIANAEDRGARNAESLPVVEARVDGGPSMRRMRPRSRGMGNMEIKRSSHIHVALDAPELS